MRRLAGVGPGIDRLGQAVYRVPDTLLDLWSFGPDGVQVQLDGASIWPVAGDHSHTLRLRWSVLAGMLRALVPRHGLLSIGWVDEHTVQRISSLCQVAGQSTIRGHTVMAAQITTIELPDKKSGEARPRH
jgi:hypothetical protein